MKGWGPLGGLSPVARWTVGGGGGLVIALLLAGGVWALLQYREATAHRAFEEAAARAQEVPAGSDEARLGQVAAALREFTRNYPRSSEAAQAWYLLGNVEYQRRDFDAAVAAFGEALARDSATVGGLSRLGAGYAWEAKGEPARALAVYDQALVGRKPGDFLYGEFLLASARIQEQLQQPETAIQTYRRFLTEVPESAWREDVRIRLAILGASPA